MGFKMKGTSMHSGTARHKSALKSIQSVEARKQSIAAAGQQSTSGESSGSPAKETDWAAMHAKANTKYNRYKGLTTEQYKAEAQRQQANFNKTGKWDAGGVYNHDGSRVDGGKSENTTNNTNTNTTENTSRVEKTSNVDTDKSKTVYRKDGNIKKKTTKSIDEDSDGRKVNKEKLTYRKDGSTKKYVHKRKDSGYDQEGEYRTKTKIKYDKKGNVKKQKDVDVRGGRRTVTKTDKQGNVTTRSRRTLKGILTGKGRKNEDNSPAQKRSPAKCPLVAAAVPALVGGAAAALGKKAAAKKLGKRSPAKCPLIAAAAPALIGAAAKGIGGAIGKKAGEKATEGK